MHLYEDLVDVAISPKLVARAQQGTRVLTSTNLVVGVQARRGDGTFGHLVPGTTPVQDPGFQVSRGPTATLEIAIEVKILAKAMIKQIDRVCNDLNHQAQVFNAAPGHPITIAIVGINHAQVYRSYEGDRVWDTTGTDGHLHPYQEAPEAEQRLIQRASTSFSEFLALRFSASNAEPYTFAWVNAAQTEQLYGAALVRISNEYEQRF